MKRYIGVALVFCLIFIIAVLNRDLLTIHKEKENSTDSNAKASEGFDDKPLTIVTGGPTGVYFQLGNALARVYGEKLGIQASVETTDASVENISKIAQKKAELGFSMADMLASSGGKEKAVINKKDLSNVRAIASLYPNYMQIVALKSARIHTLQDLKGKNVVVGALGSGTEVLAMRILNSMDISTQDFHARFLPFSEGIEGIKNGTADAAFLSSGYPNSGITELASTNEIELISVPEDVTAKLKKSYSPLGSGMIPADTYKDVNTETKTVMVKNLLITNKDMPQKKVYELTKALFENIEELEQTNSSAEKITLAKAVEQLPLPLHPGAKKYYEEKGIIK
ncbi:TAXI family TRAP transporter solute-binding subunit [Priestia megaterium]|uniref:TAXI family TRAP transporter solute-binding subunit n=1 Tax=Priestia TaxID=2800373 RepID=UPI00196AB42C|nr:MULTISPECIES: TAXI family TRAP transporter solute-binding subunit [Priestia]MDN3361963.1 TAXI family TRAP transporter solute-binding subunit [Priestia megaterium]MED3816348.1 TAXI family TRAP transporter solute-binding subunit [Priestia aryabhattai]QSF33719.1 TAXI family TRAP transporter solute-binding subunit [Priestia megaterium]